MALAMFGLTWTVSGWIITGASLNLILVGALCVAIAMGLSIMRDWRSGIFIFFVWLVFEDMIRKYAGNSVFIFFAKDGILGLTYISMFLAKRRGQLLTFKPPFIFWLSIFFWLGAVQIFNTHSPSVFYGLLGMKTYFYYVPLMFAGYAIIRAEADLHKVLMLNMWIALVVASLGVLQSFGGGDFLTPKDIAPELYELSHVVRMAPQSKLQVARATSVFVSDGRFASFLTLLYILAFGTAAYLLMRTKHGRKVVFPAVGVIALATVLEGSRGAFMYLLIDTLILTFAVLWGAPWRQRQVFRLGKALRMIVLFGGVAIILAIVFFPEAVKARWALYSETLNPASATYEMGQRGWDYPLKNLESVFKQANWVWGNGIGTASLGKQYVTKMFGVPWIGIGAESGYGTLILELGIIGPFLWTMWTVSLMIQSWKVVRKLKQTPFFPIGFAMFWYAFMLLIFFTFYGLNTYQNYVTNAYLWLTMGMLFRLPSLLVEQEVAAAIKHDRAEA